MENYSAPPISEEEMAFQAVGDAWAESLINRHDPGGVLTKLPFDPDRYPFQRMNNVMVEAYEPSWQDLMEQGGYIGVQNRLLNELRGDCEQLIGRENYWQLVGEIMNQGDIPGSTIRIMLGRMNAPRQDVAAVTLHGKIMSLPLLQAARTQATASSSYVSSPNFRKIHGDFDLFQFTKQNYTFVNSAVTKIGIRNPEGEPTAVIDWLRKFSNVVVLVPPTTSSTSMGISRDTRKKINGEAMEAFAASITNLHNQNKSALLTIDPTASTAEHIYGPDGSLKYLQHKRINPLAAGMIQQNFKYVLPELIWWDKNPRQPGWYFGKPVVLTELGSSGRAQRDFSSMMAELAAAESDLSGAEVFMGNSAIDITSANDISRAV